MFNTGFTPIDPWVKIRQSEKQGDVTLRVVIFYLFPLKMNAFPNRMSKTNVTKAWRR